MNNFFSIGEICRMQGISHQTLIYYDKIGLFRPAYTDPKNGYRYYSAAQLDYLDTICIMKRIGFSLKEIREHMEHFTLRRSLAVLRKQAEVLRRQMEELQMILSRVEHRCLQLEHSAAVHDTREAVMVEETDSMVILEQAVEPPFTLEQLSIATKECFVRSWREHLPVFFQSGAVVPFEHIREGRYTEASHAFLPIEKECSAGAIAGVRELPAGRCVVTYHKGDYLSIGKAYERILDYCRKEGLNILSDSHELAMNDYLSTGDEEEYMTKIFFYVQ